MEDVLVASSPHYHDIYDVIRFCQSSKSFYNQCATLSFWKPIFEKYQYTLPSILPTTMPGWIDAFFHAMVDDLMRTIIDDKMTVVLTPMYTMVTEDYTDAVKKISHWYELDPGYQVYGIYIDDHYENLSIYFNTRSTNKYYIVFVFQLKQFLYDILSQYPYYIEIRKKPERLTEQQQKNMYNYFWR